MRLRALKTPQRESRMVHGQIATDRIRHETLHDIDHLVAPVVAMVEGVHHASNSETPELALAEEFAREPAAWNGIPVTLGHPVRAGELVSAGRPDVFETEVIGTTFHFERSEDNRLRGEVWINLERVEEMGDAASALVQRIESGEQVEISLGLFAMIEPKDGVRDGEKFNGIWRGILPDHLALLGSDQVGACSWEDGCGVPRWNEAAIWHLQEGDDADAADAVAPPSVPEEGSFIRLVRWAREQKIKLFGPQGELSDEERRDLLWRAIADDSPSEIHDIFIFAVFDDRVVYSSGSDLFQRSYEISSSGEVSLGDDRVEVRPRTEFVPIDNEGRVEMTPKEKKVDALISNTRTRFNADNRKWLLSLSEEQLEMLEPTEEAESEDEGSGEEDRANAATCQACASRATSEGGSDEGSDEGSNEGSPDSEQTPEQFLRSVPAPMRDMFRAGLDALDEERRGLTEFLVGLDSCEFTAEDLKAKSLDDLRKLARLSGLSAPTTTIRPLPRRAEGGDGRFADPPPSIYKQEESA